MNWFVISLLQQNAAQNTDGVSPWFALFALGGISWIAIKLFANRGNIPSPPAYKSDWREERRERQESERKIREQNQQRLVQQSHRIAHEILTRNDSLVNQFLSIAERKVSILDDYGDENWDSLDREIYRCIEKIAAAEDGSVSVSSSSKRHTNAIRPSPLTPHDSVLQSIGMFSGPGVYVSSPEGYDHHALYSEIFHDLEKRFRSFHSERASAAITTQELGRMSGVEFENYLMRSLKARGCTVSGTPTTGDQGADIIARYSDRTIVIQAKRSSKPVGNKAVQEVVAALAFYQGTEAWVITNSTFTEAARELAAKNRVRLVCGADIPHLPELLQDAGI